MTTPDARELQQTTLQKWRVILDEAATAEVTIELTFKEETQKESARHETAVTFITTTASEQREAAESYRKTTITEADTKARLNTQQAGRQFKERKAQIVEEAYDLKTGTSKQFEEAKWLADTVFEASHAGPKKAFEQTCEDLSTNLSDLEETEDCGMDLLRGCRLRRLINQSPPAASCEREGGESPSAVFAALCATAEQGLEDLTALSSPRWFKGIRPWFIIGLAMVVGGGIAGSVAAMRSPDHSTAWTIIGALAFLTVAGLGMRLLNRQACKLANVHWTVIKQAGADARHLENWCIEAARSKMAKAQRDLEETRENELRVASEKHEPRLEQIEPRRKRRLEKLQLKYDELLIEINERHTAKVKETLEDSARDLKAADEHETTSIETEHTQHATAIQQITDTHALSWTDAITTFRAGVDECTAATNGLRTDVARQSPPWESEAWTNWTPPAAFDGLIDLGVVDVDLATIVDTQPTDDRFQLPENARADQPLVLAYPRHGSLLIETDEHGRRDAIGLLRSTATRLLTSLPPGKVRLTIIDPVGLGEHFAGFMHLADFDEAHVMEKIWSEPRHIEQQLADLTEHMETVIQKYLRNEYETIDQYNAAAGEIAEPYRVLLFADVPVNLSEIAAKRLMSILASGTRCGVYTLLMRDLRQTLPKTLNESDLAEGSLVLRHTADGWRCAGSAYEGLPIQLAVAPPESLLTTITQIVGEAAGRSHRVEVPFETIVPPADQWWANSTDQDVRAPLGQSGASRLQEMILGHGTSQHALVAGKTGSGKSTLLHVLITSLALRYSPDEVELYLVDFKKGVEFKTYAVNDLPHARVIAIESDREFGLSVLRRLDEVLKARGELLRDAAVQDLSGYRKLGNIMPRILLIIDEFQEFFTDDDQIAQEASLLLDRLVRQGRAFGMHLMLGSQTLDGAYSLARSTLGQMAVRVALQCTEADSYLILSEDNAAARLLSRPGEAIYNDAGGRVEGNSPFQVVWLDEARRDEVLADVRSLEATRYPGLHRDRFIFEGNIPADLTANTMLRSVIEAAPDLPNPPLGYAWLGDAIAIKDPTAAPIRTQSGSNLVMVGQRDEQAMAMEIAAITSLAAQYAPAVNPTTPGAIFRILDGTPPDNALSGSLKRLAGALPHDTTYVSWRRTEEAMQELHDILTARQEAQDDFGASIFVIIHGLQRFRDLRRNEDDFGFSEDDSGPPTADKIFAELVREGPSLGIHVITWVDTLNNLNRVIDRQSMREFEMRVLFQMSATDSSNLIETPAAANLGLQRALFFDEERGEAEKFRPYALPSKEWIHEIGEAITQKWRAAVKK